MKRNHTLIALAVLTLLVAVVLWDVVGPAVRMASGQRTDRPEQVMAVGVADRASYALQQNGTLWGWGWNLDNQLGGLALGGVAEPIVLLRDVTAFSSNRNARHVMAITRDRQLWGWGLNDYGQVGVGHTDPAETPQPVLDNVVDVAVGWNYTMALRGDGSVWLWGRGDRGYIGDGDAQDRLEPVQVLEHAAAICAGNYPMVILQDGTLWNWGSGSYAAEHVSGDAARVPVQMAEDVAAVAAGGSMTWVTLQDGSIWWLEYRHGFWSPGWSDEEQNVSFLHESPYRDVTIYPDSFNQFMVGESGNLYAWGDNFFGTLGTGLLDNSVEEPVAVMQHVRDVAFAREYALVLQWDGSLWIAGNRGIYRFEGIVEEFTAEMASFRPLGFDFEREDFSQGEAWGVYHPSTTQVEEQEQQEESRGQEEEVLPPPFDSWRELTYDTLPGMPADYDYEDARSVCDLFVYFMETGVHFDPDTQGMPRGNDDEDYNVYYSTLMAWHAFEQSIFFGEDVTVKSVEPVRSWYGQGYDYNRPEAFLLELYAAHDNPDTGLRAGYQSWVLTVMEPVYGESIPLPHNLTTLQKHEYMLEAAERDMPISQLCDFLSICTRALFDSPADLPEENWLTYILLGAPDLQVGTAGASKTPYLTRAQVAHWAELWFGVSELPETVGMSFVMWVDEEDEEVYSLYDGWGPPYVAPQVTFGWEDADGAHLLYEWYDSADSLYCTPSEVVQYTLRDGRVVSAVDVSDKVGLSPYNAEQYDLLRAD